MANDVIECVGFDLVALESFLHSIGGIAALKREKPERRHKRPGAPYIEISPYVEMIRVSHDDAEGTVTPFVIRPMLATSVSTLAVVIRERLRDHLRSSGSGTTSPDVASPADVLASPGAAPSPTLDQDLRTVEKFLDLMAGLDFEVSISDGRVTTRYIRVTEIEAALARFAERGWTVALATNEHGPELTIKRPVARAGHP